MRQGAAVYVKTTSSYDVTPCGLEDAKFSEKPAVSTYRKTNFRFLRNFATFLPDYKESYSKEH